MRGKGKDRKFTTPVLPSNTEYQYWVTATFDQNGESATQYRKVIVERANTPSSTLPGRRNKTPSDFPPGR